MDLSTQAQLRPFIVHERFTELGGSELVVEQLHAMWPEATIGTTVLDRTALPLGLRDAHIETSPLQRIYRGGSRYAQLLPLLPLAMRFMHIPECDVIITSHHAFSNRIRGRRDAPIVSYTHTPPRWLWDSEKLRAESGGVVGSALLRTFAATQRHADRAAAQRVDRIVANSHHVAGRIRKWWDREAVVVYPPVDTERLTCVDVAREEFFLLAGRLIPYKRPDVAIAAARQAGVRLVVAGDGRMRKTLESESGSGIEFLGRVTDDELRDLYRRCRALVFPGEEDFGIVPVEAQACGAPVIALAIGGANETVVHGSTGVLYEASREDEVGQLAEQLRQFRDDDYATSEIRANAERFSKASFQSNMRKVVDDAVAEFRRSGRSPAVR